MSSLMVCQVTLGGEAHLTVSKVAFKRFLAIMDSHVCKEISLFSEGFLTAIHLAYEWSFTRLKQLKA